MNLDFWIPSSGCQLPEQLIPPPHTNMCLSLLPAASPTAETHSALTKEQTERDAVRGQAGALYLRYEQALEAAQGVCSCLGSGACQNSISNPFWTQEAAGIRQMKASFRVHLLNTGTSSPIEGLPSRPKHWRFQSTPASPAIFTEVLTKWLHL